MWELQKILVSVFFILRATATSSNDQADNQWDWVETGTLGMVTGGDWLDPVLCRRPGSFVTNYTIRFDNNNKEILGLTLWCSILDRNNSLQTVDILNVNEVTKGHPSVEQSGGANRFAVGFSLARWADVQGFEYVAGRQLTFVGQKENQPGFKYRFPRKSVANAEINATLFSIFGCPDGWAICGVRGRSTSGSSSIVDRDAEIKIVTQLRFKCCYYCLPIEQRVILDDFTNHGSTAYVRTLRITEGTQIDTSRAERWSTGQRWDKAGEIQRTNSRSLTQSQSETTGETETRTKGQGSNSGWVLEEDLQVFSSTQSTKGHKSSTGTNSLKTNSETTGQSTTNIDSNHWSQSKGNSASHTAEVSASLTASAGVSFMVASAGVSATARASLGSTRGRHEEQSQGGSSTKQSGTTKEIGSSTQSGSSTDNTDEHSESVGGGKHQTNKAVQSGGNTTSLEETRQTSAQKAKERSMQEGAQAMFLSRKAQSSSLDFNWDQTDSSMWREEREETHTFTCAPMSRCKVEQIYGTCGGVKIGTPQTFKTDTRLQEINPSVQINSNELNSETKWNITIPGETWVVAKHLSYWEPKGTWENAVVCPTDTVVTGHSIKFLRRFGITGITLACTPKYGRVEEDEDEQTVQGETNRRWFLRIEPGNTKTSKSKKNETQVRQLGEWGPNYIGSRRIFARGFNIVRMEWHGRQFMGKFEIQYHDMQALDIPVLARNSSRVLTSCPIDHSVCGVSAMLDKAGKGIFTGLAFKCCHHCVPIERWISVQDYINRGSVEQRRDVRTTVGIQESKTRSDSGSSSIVNTVDSEGLKKGFSARFGLSNSSGFDWSHTTQSIWTDETTVTDYFVCEPGMSCTYRKLVGECGSVRIPVNKFEKISIPLIENQGIPGHSEGNTRDNTDLDPDVPTLPNYLTQLDDESTPVEILHDGSIWIEALDMQLQNSGQRSNIRGHWDLLESCPPGSFATDNEWQHHPESTETQVYLTGVLLHCSRWDDKGGFVPVSVISGQRSSSRGHQGQKQGGSSDSGILSPLVGLQYLLSEWKDEDTGLLYNDVGQHSFISDPRGTPLVKTDGKTTIKITCPTNYVICGLSTRKDSITGILSDLRLQCCYHCEPTESLEDLNTLENPDDETVKETIPDVVYGAEVQLDKNRALMPGSKVLRKGVTDYNYLRAMFAHRLPRKSSGRLAKVNSKFDWGKQSESLWTRIRTKSAEMRCEGKSFCTLKQLVGFCNDLRIPTSYTTTEAEALNN